MSSPTYIFTYERDTGGMSRVFLKISEISGIHEYDQFLEIFFGRELMRLRFADCDVQREHTATIMKLVNEVTV